MATAAGAASQVKTKQRVPVCVATEDGSLWHPEAIGVVDISATLRDCFFSSSTSTAVEMASVEFFSLANGSEDPLLERLCNTLLVYEVPRSRIDEKATPYAHMRDLLTKRDAVELVGSRRQSGERIIAVHVNFFSVGDAHHDDTYLAILRDLSAVAAKSHRKDRTGTGTVSVFGRQFRFDLSNNALPLLTTKKLHWRKVLEELLWFARGETDVAELQKRGVHIWDGNSSRVFLDSVGLHGNADGDIGPGYGFQWRHFGAEYGDGPKAGDFTKYAGQGVDQLAHVEHLLKTDPFSRRIVMTAWNPAALNRMALPPCHALVQFYVEDVDGDRRLSCHMYQRSVDTFLGFPWNIASYAMLTHLLAVRNDMTASELIISTGDTHLYTDHFDAARQQIARAPLPVPRIEIDPSVAHKKWEDIDSKNDVAVVGYYCHPVISAKMSA